MKCPYRKITYHYPITYNYTSVPPSVIANPSTDSMKAAYDEESFAECYGEECPYYDNGFCKRVLREGGTE